jgi:hypothetical protein
VVSVLHAWSIDTFNPSAPVDSSNFPLTTVLWFLNTGTCKTFLTPPPIISMLSGLSVLKIYKLYKKQIDLDDFLECFAAGF